jgi:hypothetical protein
MGTEYGFDDTTWTIKESTWDADPDDLAQIDFDVGAFYLAANTRDNWHWHNLDVKNGTNGNGIMYLGSIGATLIIQGCLFTKTHNSCLINLPSNNVLVMDRVVVTGSGAGASQFIYFYGCTYLNDVAIYNLGDQVIVNNAGRHFWNSFNLGIEQANGSDDLYLIYGPNIKAKDFNVGNALASFTMGGPVTPLQWQTCIENFQRVLGAHKVSNSQGEITSKDVVSGSGDPYKRTGGADTVVEILYDRSGNLNAAVSPYPLALAPVPVFEHEFEATTDNRKYRYYVQAEGAVLASELWMEVEYVKSHDDTSEYTITKLTSDQAISARVDASDWSQYLEVLNVNPALASKVRIKIYCSYYDATNKIYIDPLPEVTT